MKTLTHISILKYNSNLIVKFSDGRLLQNDFFGMRNIFKKLFLEFIFAWLLN